MYYFRSLFLFFLIAQNVAKAQPCPLSISGNTAVCPGFQTTLTAFGASSYTWTSASFTAPVSGQSISVNAGTYTLSGNTSTCTLIVNVTQLPPLSIQLSQSSATTCMASNLPAFSNPVTYTAQGAASYVWFSSTPQSNFPAFGPSVAARPAANSCYTVVGSTSACSGSAIGCVTVIPQFTITVSPVQSTICSGESKQLSITLIGQLAVGPASAFTYSWNEPGLTLNNNLLATVIASPLSNTTYTVMVFDSRGCISIPNTVSVSVSDCTGIPENKTSEVSIFPNPFGSSLKINSVEPVLVELFDALGKRVYSMSAQDGPLTIPTASLDAGVYFLSVINAQGEKTVVKVVRE